MSLSVGIVGLPNVGKSTLFNALLKKQQALAANYPFATIEPNTGIVAVPDVRLEELAKTIAKKHGGKIPPTIPATIEFWDIAGLVAGAHKGEGLGNQFLATIREVDLICHVLRLFEDEQVVLTGKLNPIDDLKTVRMELMLKDQETLQKKQMELEKRQRSGDKQASQLLEILHTIQDGFDQGKLASQVLEKEALLMIRDWWLLSAKPELLVANVSETQLSSQGYETLRASLAGDLEVETEELVLLSAQLEADLAVLDTAEQVMYLESMGISEAGIGRMAQAAYSKLDLFSFLTAGEKECRAWTVRRGMKAPEAAGVIHTDFINKFIKAKVCNYKDFVELGGWKQVSELGKVRFEGRDYLVQDGDVIEFMIGS